MKAFAFLLLLLAAFPATAALEFETPAIKVDADLNDKTVTRDFKFTNGGDKVVKITNADAGCSCLGVEVADGKFTYAPGESGVLRATFELGNFQGTVEKRISVWLEGDPEDKPSTSVSMSVHIPVIIKVEPKSVKWQVGDPAEPKMIDVTMDYKKPIRVTSVGTSNDTFSAELITLEDGKRYQIKVTPAKGTSSAGLNIIRIATDAEIEKHRNQQAFAVISSSPKKQ